MRAAAPPFMKGFRLTWREPKVSIETQFINKCPQSSTRELSVVDSRVRYYRAGTELAWLPGGGEKNGIAPSHSFITGSE